MTKVSAVETPFQSSSSNSNKSTYCRYHLPSSHYCRYFFPPTYFIIQCRTKIILWNRTIIKFYTFYYIKDAFKNFTNIAKSLKMDLSFKTCMCDNIANRTERKEVRTFFFLANLIITSAILLSCKSSSGNVISNPTFNLNEKQPDMLCNIGDEHECVCNRSMGDLDNKYLLCDNFLEVKRLSVLCIKMRELNFKGQLHTTESYQQYFRRRIANILSKYCEHQANECPGTITAIRQQRKKEYLKRLELQKNNPSFNQENYTTAKWIEEDEEETTFTLENVVILKVTFEERNKTNVYFVVTKTRNVGSLNNAVTMEPLKVKYIMSAQIAPLSRVLGGIRIEQLKVVEMRKNRPPYNNKSLITVVLIVGISFASCCIIAIIKLIRDHRQKKTKCGVKKSSFSEKEKISRNYGTCTDKFLPTYDTPNGKPKSLNNSARSKKRKSTTCSLKTPYIAIDTIDREDLSKNMEDVKQRSLKNLFRCDPSQLPRESCEFYNNEEKNEASFSKHGKISSNSEDDDAFYSSTVNSNSPQHHPLTDNEVFHMKHAVLPSVILVSSNSEAFITEANNNDKKVPQLHPFMDDGALTTPCEIERPLSRRGSRESTPEQGAEECRSSREDTPIPLGDKLLYAEERSETAKHAVIKIRRTSSSSESDEDDSKVYYPLNHYIISENEDNEEINNKIHKTETILESKCVKKNNLLPYSSNSAGSSDSGENNIEEAKETSMLDRHQYKRLQESPIPPPITANSDIRYDM